MSYESTINYNNLIVETFITGSTNTSFDRVNLDTIMIDYVDPITGGWINGDYTFDAFGVVQEYDFLMRIDSAAFKLFASFDLNGGVDDFINHAATFDAFANDPNTAGYIFNAVASNYGQGLANVIDTFPGSERYDPYSTSTGIKAGYYGEFYSA